MADRNRSRVLDGAEVRAPFTSVERKPEVDPEEERRREREAGRKAGYDEGFKQGVAQVTAQFEQKAVELRSELAAALKQLVVLEEERLHEAAQLLSELALRTAERILREKIEQGDAVATRAIEQAIGVLPPGVSIKARVHPDDIEGATETLEGEVAAGKLTLIGDAAVTRGGCVIESDAGTVDATVEAALSAAADALTEREQDTGDATGN